MSFSQPLVKVQVNRFGREAHRTVFLIDQDEVHVGMDEGFSINTSAGRHEFEVYVECRHGTLHGSTDYYIARAEVLRHTLAVGETYEWIVDIGEIKETIWGAGSLLGVGAMRLFGAKTTHLHARESWPILLHQRIEEVAARQTQPSLVKSPEPNVAFDVFISHASEDKQQFVRPLAAALRSRGLRVWYDEFELRIGDSLRRKIDRGLATSRSGIVVLSPAFFSKGWTNYELDGLVALSMGRERSILPIWHGVTAADVAGYSPTLADRVGRDTTIYSVDKIAEEIAHALA